MSRDLENTGIIIENANELMTFLRWAIVEGWLWRDGIHPFHLNPLNHVEFPFYIDACNPFGYGTQQGSGMHLQMIKLETFIKKQEGFSRLKVVN